MIVKHLEVSKELYSIYINEIHIGKIEKSDLRDLIGQLDSIIT